MARPKKQELALSELERKKLLELTRSRTAPQGLVRRAEIVLASADGETSTSIEGVDVAGKPPSVHRALHPNLLLMAQPVVNRWFGHISEKAIRRDSFRSAKELVSKIEELVAHYNEHARPFVRTATADSVLKRSKIYANLFAEKDTNKP
jgi:hypothetical protein